MIEIIEVIERSVQGKTRPFICRGSDDAIYFVKGRDAGKRSLICEWICGCLARELTLPLPAFEIAYVSPALLRGPETLQLSDLGAGPVFASKQRRGTEFTWQTVGAVSRTLRQDVLLFDWWIKNGDRCFSERGGNPNLFWTPDSGELIVIDHNVALDETVQAENFLTDHVFRDDADAVFGDMVIRAEYTQRLLSAMSHWDTILADIPEEWRYLDADFLDPVAFDWDGAYALLMAFESEAFWTTQ